MLKRLKRQANAIPKAIEDARKNKNRRGVLTEFKVPGSRLGMWNVIVSLEDGCGADHWSVSFMLHPKGRSSIEQDWHALGYALAQLYKATESDPDGYPMDVTDMKTNDPNAPHHFYWHADGTECRTSVADMRTAITAYRKKMGVHKEPS